MNATTVNEWKTKNPMNENTVFCLNCSTLISSRSVHDYRTCSCKIHEEQVSVDGGDEYVKRGYGERSRWIERDGRVFHGGVEVQGRLGDPSRFTINCEPLDDPLEIGGSSLVEVKKK